MDGSLPQPQSPGVPPVFRAAAVGVAFLSVLTAGLLAMGAAAAANGIGQTTPTPALYAPVVAAVAVGVALAAAVEGVGRLVAAAGGRRPAAGPAVDLDPLLATVAEVRDAVLTLPVPAPVAEAAAPAVEPGESTVDQHLAKMVRLLEEMKELSMLDEGQRQARRHQAMDRRKASRLDEADRLTHHHQYEEADALLTLLESLHPGDADVLAARTTLDDARGAARAAAWEQLSRHVEDLMALSRYDDAAEAVNGFIDAHPGHAPCRALAGRVAQERDAYVDRAVAGLFQEIKLAAETRQWRLALDQAERFLVSYPDHARSEAVRRQVPVIRRNAEIEERRSQEHEIKVLARNGSYAEAAALCEDLLARYPDSPQAGNLAALLPKLRDRAEGGEMVGTAFGQAYEG